MLTPPKWHSVWLKSQNSSQNIFKNTMFFKRPDTLFDELRKCCNSTSKDLTLKALSCWRIWIESQEDENWKENEICYTAVSPLVTKKFHPLHRDVEVSETKLSLMWLALWKTQGLMHLEGPQHILEVFIQSCQSWLSCSDEIGCNIEDLILKLLRSLFSSNVEFHKKNEKFPLLNTNIWKSNKLFCRLVTLLLKIFQNWSKIKEKTDLLHIWKHFLDHCEQSFKLIPVEVWHKIFKLVESISSDQKEFLQNKISLLHKCATSLKSVLSNSKFIDCSQVLTTPAEALMKIVIELSLNNKEENISFDIFQHCTDICHNLSRVIHNSGYEYSIDALSKIEDIETKPLLWGLWCGLVTCFRQLVNNENIETYSKMELKLYRKLRSLAINFDLDRMFLEERSILLIQDQLHFLRIPITCQYCSAGREKSTDDQPAMEVPTLNPESPPPSNPVNESKDELAGGFGFDIKSCVCLRENQSTESLMEIDLSETYNKNKGWANRRVVRWSVKRRWGRRCGLDNLNICRQNWFRFDNIEIERLIGFEKGCRVRLSFAPMCLTVLLEELCKIARKSGEPSAENFVEKVKKVQTKVKDGEIASPIKLFLSLKGSNGVEFYSNAVRFWYDLDEIINDLDLMKNLNILKAKNNKSVVGLSMFFFLVNFGKNLYFEDRENGFFELGKIDVEEEDVLTERLINFMRKVSHYKNRLSNFTFLESMNRVLPTKSDNPLILWTNFVMARNSKGSENDNSVLGNPSPEEACCRTTNDNLINIFKCFDEFESKISKDDLPLGNSVTRKRKSRCGNKRRRSSVRLHNRPLMMPNTKEVKIMENESVTVVEAPPDVFRTISFSEWRTDAVVGGDEVSKEKPSRKKRRNSKTAGCEVAGKRSRLSLEGRACGEVVQDENVNIENRKSEASMESPRTQKKSNMNPTLSPKGVYSLRKRPLQRPSKFNDMKLLFADESNKGKSLNKNCETENNECLPCARDCDGFTREESQEIKVFKGEVDAMSHDLTPNTDDDKCGKLISPVEEDTKKCVDIKTEVVSDLKDELITIKIQETDLDSEHFEISELINNLIEQVEKAEDSRAKYESASVKSPETIEVDHATVCVSPQKTREGMKRRLKSIFDEATAEKRLKCEESEKPVETEQEEIPPKPMQKRDMPVIQNRGSRMLALVPESPKLNGFHDSSSSKQQTMKPPNVMRNSRASRMLALLPELQEPSPSVQSVSVKETTTLSDDDNTKKGISAYTGGIIHHLTPSRKGSAISSESPKGSPLRQRRSIRFDDDRNETVTYFTDSPPCQTIKQGTRFRGSDK